MWKNVAIVALLAVLALLWSDLMRLFERMEPRDVITLLVIAGTIAAVSFLRHAARRL